MEDVSACFCALRGDFFFQGPFALGESVADYVLKMGKVRRDKVQNSSCITLHTCQVFVLKTGLFLLEPDRRISQYYRLIICYIPSKAYY